MILYLYHVNKNNYYIVRDSMIIGRTTGHLKIEEDGALSSQHTQLILDRASNTVGVIDLNSKNHTIVDRQEIPPQERISMKLYSLLELGSQKFILFDTRNASKDLIEQILEDKEKIPVTKLVAQKLVGDLKDRLSQEIAKLGASELDIIDKIKKCEVMKLDALKEYEARIKSLQEEIASHKEHIQMIQMQVQDRQRKLEKLVDSADSATRTLIKKA